MYTYPVYVNLTLAGDEETVNAARRRAEQLGTSLNQLIRNYLEELAGRSDRDRRADEFIQLSRHSPGDSRGWKFNREELHQR